MGEVEDLIKQYNSKLFDLQFLLIENHLRYCYDDCSHPRAGVAVLGAGGCVALLCVLDARSLVI